MVARRMFLGGADSRGCAATIQAELRKLLTKGGVICHGETRLAAWRTMLENAKGGRDKTLGE